MIDSILGGVTNIVSQGLSALGDIIGDAILNAINTFIGNLLYFIDWSECAILHLVYQFFGIFAGISRVAYKGEEDYLINVFFSNSSITNIYWAMAMIGIILAVGFTIWAVIKKMFDIEDQEKRSLGGILGSLLKAVVIIAAMNFIIAVTLNMTNVLMQRVTYAFDNAESLDDPDMIVYTEDQYVYMNDIMETIGTYAMNPSYTSRYNINSCFNAIRPQLKVLESTGMFDVYYETERTVTVNGKEEVVNVDTWQSVLQKIVRASSLDSDVSMDVYHESLNTAIVYAMNCLRTNDNFYPLQYYEAKYSGVENADLDVVIFMTGTGEAAKNDEYNTNVSISDALRGAYVYGDKSIYSHSDVTSDFNIGLFGGINHLLIIVLCILMIKELIVISLAAVVRIFSMLLLYLISPPIIATMPLDNGEKFKQWITAFVVQAFSLFGTVIAMRLLILFIPIILSSDLELLENPVMNLAAKAFLIYGGTVAAERASGMVTGILSGNAGWQAVQAGDVRGKANDMMKQTGLGGLATAGITTAVGAGKMGWNVGKAMVNSIGGGGSPDSGPSGGAGGGPGGGGSTPGGGSLGGNADSGSAGGGSASGGSTPGGSLGVNSDGGSSPAGGTLGGDNSGGSAEGGSIPSGETLGGNTDSGSTPSGSVPSNGTLGGNATGSGSQAQRDANLKNLFGEQGFQQIQQNRQDAAFKNLFGEQGFQQIQAQRMAKQGGTATSSPLPDNANNAFGSTPSTLPDNAAAQTTSTPESTSSGGSTVNQNLHDDIYKNLGLDSSMLYGGDDVPDRGSW